MKANGNQIFAKTLKINEPFKKKISALNKALKNGANINFTFKLGEVNLSPLHWAASQGQKEGIEYMLNHGADINAQASNGYTPLMYAANHLEAVEILLKHKADPSIATESDGTTALMIAAHGGWGVNRDSSLEIVKLLVKSGAKITTIDSYGNSALDRALRATLPKAVKENDPVAQHLISLGLKPKAKKS